MRVIWLLLLLCGLAACASEPQVTDAPFYTSTPRELATTDPANPETLFDGTTIPLNFAGGEPQVLGMPGSFRFAVNGAVSASLESGTVVAATAARFGTTPERMQVIITASDANGSHELVFSWNPALVSGVYEIISPGTFAADEITATYTRLGADNNGSTELQTFADTVDGSITLTIAPDRISGLFQFSAQRTVSSDAGEVEVQTVQISGEFSDAVLISGDDPFENIIPLPTRNFTQTATP